MSKVASHFKRVEVLDRVSKAVGFPIREDECSPQHRMEINQLALALEEQESTLNKIRTIHESDSLGPFVVGIILLATLIVFLFIHIGQIVNALITGAVAGVVAFFFHFISAKIHSAAINKKRRLTIEATKLKKDIDAKVIELSSSIKAYLFVVDKAKTSRPINVDFGQLLNALKRKGIILETIECPNCGGKLEISEIPKKEEIFECKHCGKPILAVNAFEKFKEILGI